MIKGTYKSERKEKNSLVIGYGNSELLKVVFFCCFFFLSSQIKSVRVSK